MERYSIFFIFIFINGLVVVDSQCGFGQHDCYTSLAGFLQDSDRCSKLTLSSVEACRGKVLSECEAQYQQANLDGLETLKNYTLTYCGTSGDCSNIETKIQEVTECTDALSNAGNNPSTTNYCQIYQDLLTCIQTKVGTCNAGLVTQQVNAMTGSVCSVCSSLTFQGNSICEGVQPGEDADLFACVLGLSQCFASAPDLTNSFQSAGSDLDQVCKAYNNLGSSKITELNNCISGISCPADPTMGQGSSENMAVFALKSIDAVCSCESFSSIYKECQALGDSVDGQSGGNTNCRTVEQFACCAKPLVKDCPDVWFMISNPPDMIEQGETFDSVLRQCNIDPKLMEGDSISGDKCKDIYTGSGSRYNLNLLLAVSVLLMWMSI